MLFDNFRSKPENLLAAAIHCYRDKGVSGTGMEDVAQQAGVGRATLYRHFKNQEALLSEVMAHNLEALKAILATSLKGCTKAEGILRDWVTKPLLQEWISRLLLSFLITPSTHLNSEKKMRKFFHSAVMSSIIDRS